MLCRFLVLEWAAAELEKQQKPKKVPREKLAAERAVFALPVFGT